MRSGTFYGINVSQNGKHVLATDSHIRSYNAHQVAMMIKQLRRIFPKDPRDPDESAEERAEKYFKIDVTIWNVSTSALPDEIAELCD